MFRFDVEENNGNYIALSRGDFGIDELKNNNSAVDIPLSLITSTTKNPARYTCKIPLDDLVAFLRKDWEKRQISMHFSIATTTDSEALPLPEIPADVVRLMSGCLRSLIM